VVVRREIDDLNEHEVKIEGKSFDDEQVRQIWAKNELIFRRYSDYWLPILREGKNLMDYLHGKIFDAKTRDIYENVLGKICIEPRTLKKRINTLMGHLQDSRRSGRVVTEGSRSADSVRFANMVLKYFEQTIGETNLLNRMAFTGCVTGYPQACFFERAITAYGAPLGGLVADIAPWDSYVLTPGFEQPNGSDVRDTIRITRKTRQELIDENPEMKEQIDRLYSQICDSSYGGGYDRLKGTDGLTAEDARYLNYDIMTGAQHTRSDGRMLCMERMLTAKVRMPIAISKVVTGNATLDYQILPPTWDKERKDLWLIKNPNYVMNTQDVKMLWRCRWTREGLMLKNKYHWFQEHTDKGDPVVPMVVFTPQIVDGKPTGPGPDDKQLILMKAIMETEYLHDVRTGSGDLLAYRKGKVGNAEDLPTEMSIGNGIAQITDENDQNPITNQIAFLRRTPNDTYGAYAEKIEMDLNRTDMISEVVQGQSGQYQSDKAKRTDIAQVLVGYSFLKENYNSAFERFKQMECMLIPYCLTEEQVLQIDDDESREPIKLQVNEKLADYGGNIVTNPANDLSGIKWRWRLIPGDDSPTARQAELNEMLIFWNTTAPALIEADPTLAFLASVLKSMSNRTAKEIGRIIEQKAEIQAQIMNQQQLMASMAELEEKRGKADAERLKAARSGFSFSITPEDLVQIPGLFKILVEGNYINTGQGFQFQLPQAGAPVAA
jgi:hypothetical protein